MPVFSLFLSFSAARESRTCHRILQARPGLGRPHPSSCSCDDSSWCGGLCLPACPLFSCPCCVVVLIFSSELFHKQNKTGEEQEEEKSPLDAALMAAAAAAAAFMHNEWERERETQLALKSQLAAGAQEQELTPHAGPHCFFLSFKLWLMRRCA